MVMICALTPDHAAEIARTLSLGQEGTDWVSATSPSVAASIVPDRIIAYEQEGLNRASRYGLTVSATQWTAKRCRLQIEWVT